MMREHLKILTARLECLGYTELLCSAAPISENAGKWIYLYSKAEEPLKSLLELFLLGRAVQMDRIDPVIASCVPGLMNFGLLRKGRENGTVRTCNLVLVPVCGLWFFHEIPNARISLYFGDDSIALLSRQMPRRGRRSLDLCSGPGIQAMYAASRGETVTTVEINPVARDLAYVNAVMNDIDDCMDIRCGDLYGAVREDETFDRITANPPLLPMPDDVPYPFIGHGGPDGLAVTRKIIDGMGRHLLENGTGQVLGMSLGNGKEPLFLPWLRETAAAQDLDALVTVIAHFRAKRGETFFDSLAATSQSFCGSDYELICEKMEQCYLAQGAEEFITYYIQMTRGTGSVRCVDLGKGVEGVLWHV